MASSVVDMQTKITNQIQLDASAFWTIDERNSKKIVKDNHSSTKYSLNMCGGIVGKLHLMASSTVCVGRDSEFKRECVLSLSLVIEGSIIMNNIDAWKNECLPQIKKLRGSIKQIDSKLKLAIPRFTAAALEMNHIVRYVLASVIDNESVLKDLYKVSLEYISSSAFNSVISGDTIIEDLCKVSQSYIPNSPFVEEKIKARTLNNPQKNYLESVEEKPENKSLLSLFCLKKKSSSMSLRTNSVTNKQGASL